MFRMETHIDKDRHATLRKRLQTTNIENSPVIRALREGPMSGELPLQIWLMAEKTGELAGGLAGRTWARWLHVDLLWVDGRHRRAGLGRRLLAKAERFAISERSCARARLETWDFQAPDFYRKQGYRIVGEITDYPPGITEYIMVKKLTGPLSGSDGTSDS